MSYSSVRVENPEGVPPEGVREDPSGPVLIQDDDSSGDVPPAEEKAGPAPRGEPSKRDSVEEDYANDIVHISKRPPNCAELEKMLRRILCASDIDLPPSKMFEMPEMVYHGSLDFVCHITYFLRDSYLNSLPMVFHRRW